MKKTCVFLSVFFLNVTGSFAGKELVIFPTPQDQTLWCWAACCEMIFDAYKITSFGSVVDQYEVAGWAVSGNNVANELSGGTYSVDEVLLHFGTINSNYT